MTDMKYPLLSWLVWIIGGALVFGIALHVRLTPLTQEVTSDLEDRASAYVVSRLQQNLRKQIEQQSPGISEAHKDRLVKDRLQQVMRDDRDKIRLSIDQVTRTLRQQDVAKDQKPYLLASDSYYYLDLTNQILETGKVSEETKGSKYFNAKMLAPHGAWVPQTFHPHVGYAVLSVARLIDPDIDKITALGFTPLVIVFLSFIAFLWTARTLGANPFFSVAAGVFFLLAPIFVKRSTWGWYDNDPYNVLFPVLILGWLCFSLLHIHNKPRMLAGALMAAGVVAFYSMFWQGWGFMVGVALIGGLAIGGVQTFSRNGLDIRRNVLLFTVMGLGIILGIGFLFGPRELLILTKEALEELDKFTGAGASAWPDMFVVVGELKKGDLKTIVELTGGIGAFALAVLGVTAAIVHVLFNPRHPRSYQYLLVGVFFAISFYLSMGGQRFAIFCFIPVALFSAIGMQAVWDIIKELLFPRIPNFLKGVLAVIVGAGVMYLAAMSVYSIEKSVRSLLNPIFNSTWERALIKVRETTPPDSIINSWWPPGHFIKAIADRRATFDGGSIFAPQAYWMASVFLSQSEEHALGVLRMLNGSGVKATEYLQELGYSLSQTTTLLNVLVLKSDRDEARAFLESQFPPEQIDHLLSLTHGEPPPTYLLLYDEIVNNISVFALFSQWDFAKMEEILNDPKLAARIPNKKDRAYIDFMWRIVSGPFKYSDPLAEVARNGDTLQLDEDIVVNLKTMECLVNSPKFGRGIPMSIVYSDGTTIMEKRFANPNLGYSVVLFQRDKKYTAILMDRYIANSIIVKLHFFNATGMRHFSKVIGEGSFTNRSSVDVYEVKWEGFLP